MDQKYAIGHVAGFHIATASFLMNFPMYGLNPLSETTSNRPMQAAAAEIYFAATLDSMRKMEKWLLGGLEFWRGRK